MYDTIDKISDDLAFRKKELIYLYSECKNSDILRRCYLVIAAAHFEGFVRSSVNTIYDQIERDKILYKNLDTVFTTLNIEKITEYFEKKKIKGQYCFIDFHKLVNDIPNNNFKLNKMEIRTLKYSSFKTILKILGLDDNKYELKEKWIDKSFLEYRHKIAHGENFKPSYEDITTIHKYLIEKLFEDFFKDIESYITNKKYLKNPSI